VKLVLISRSSTLIIFQEIELDDVGLEYNLEVKIILYMGMILKVVVSGFKMQAGEVLLQRIILRIIAELDFGLQERLENDLLRVLRKVDG